MSSLHGARAFDWSSSRVSGRATRGVPEAKLLAANGGGHGVDWNVTTGAAVTAAAAVWGTNWVESTPDPTDVLVFAVNGSGTGKGITGGLAGGTTAANSNLFALTNLYTTSPTLKWSLSVGTGVDGSSIALSIDGTKVYFVDTAGTLRCRMLADGTNCVTNGTTWSDYVGGSAVSGSSPWVDYAGTNDVYFGDSSGTLHHIDGKAGTSVWSMKPGPSGTYQGAMHSSPVVANGFVYIGDDLGQLFKVRDGTSASPPAAGTSDVQIFNVCSAVGSTAPCPNSPQWAIRTAIAYDYTHTPNHVYAVANDYVFELNATGAWANTSASPKHLSSGGTGPMVSSPTPDWNNNFLYTAFNSKLFKIQYPFTGSGTSGFYSTSLAHSGNTSAEPLAYNNVTYLGDASGYTERFSCTTQAGTPAVDGVTFNGTSGTAYGSSVNTPMILDYSTGNVNFGYTSGTGGGLVQYPIGVASYECPTGTTHLCTSTNGPTNTCTASGGGNYGEACRGCCTNADCGGQVCNNGTCQAACTGSGAGNCATKPNSTVACTSGACVYTCNTGWANCDGTTATNGCNIDLQNDVNNCGSCGGACSNNNIPAPICVAGTCAGHCADGYVDCKNGRQSDGCETAADNSNCCTTGTLCATGKTCYDNGGTGACVDVQATQAYGTNPEHSAASASCPSGQVITRVAFADYGTPDGAGGQSWTMTACGGTNQASCTATPGCTWDTTTTKCVTKCSKQTTQANCTATGNACAWESSRNPAECVPTASNCASMTTKTNCTAMPWCQWTAAFSKCSTYSCSNAVTQTDCSALTGCSWNSGTGTCTMTLCTAQTTQSTCTGTGVCAWDTETSTCTAASGFLHDYGVSPNNKINPNCAMDVSANPRATGCWGGTSCSITGQNGNFCGGTLPACTANPASNGTVSLPLTSSQLYPDDPCQGIYKRMYLQITCGTMGSQRKHIFVTSTSYDGAFGADATTAMNTADSRCVTAATNGGLANANNFKAYLGSSARTPSSLETTYDAYFLPDETFVGYGGELVNGGSTALFSAVFETETGADAGGVTPWTGATSAGGVAASTCTNWTKNLTTVFGEAGDSTSKTGTWAQASTPRCKASRPLYCIEQ